MSRVPDALAKLTGAGLELLDGLAWLAGVAAFVIGLIRMNSRTRPDEPAG